jgi:hypothetical protein
MRAFAVVRIVVAAAIIAGAVAIAQWGGLHGDAHKVLKALFDNASGFPRQALVVLAVAAPIVAVLTIARLLRRRRRTAPAQVLSLFNALAPLVGIAAAIFDVVAALRATPAGHTAPLMAMAPALAEAALILGLGLLVGAVAALPRGASWNGGEG